MSGARAPTDLTARVLIAVSALPRVLFWRANSGLFRTMDGRSVTRANVTGCPDILGCVGVYRDGILRGQAVGIETKLGRGKQRASQEVFQAIWEEAGGCYIVARSPEQAVAAVCAMA